MLSLWVLQYVRVAVICSVVQCVAVRCSVLQYVADCRSVLQCLAVCCSVLQCVVACCSVLQHIAVCCSVLQCFNRVLQCFDSVLQRVALCYSALQCHVVSVDKAVFQNKQCVAVFCRTHSMYILQHIAKTPCNSGKKPYISEKRAMHVRKRGSCLCKRALYLHQRVLQNNLKPCAYTHAHTRVNTHPDTHKCARTHART